MDQSDQEQLVALVEKMPAFPGSVQKVLELSTKINVSAKEIILIIERDPVLTAKILKVINSAIYGLPEKISSVHRAVILIGLNTVKNLMLSVAALGMLNARNKAGFDVHEFLVHSLTTAAISRRLAERSGFSQKECSDSFVVGLLHDFGKMVFAEFKHDAFKRAIEMSKDQGIPLHRAEIDCIGFNHAEVGQMLAAKWGFSQLLVDAIARHHDIPDNSLADCVYAANQITKLLKLGNAGNPGIDPYPEVVVKRFGLPISGLMNELGDLTAIRLESAAFINP